MYNEYRILISYILKDDAFCQQTIYACDSPGLFIHDKQDKGSKMKASMNWEMARNPWQYPK